MPINNNAAIEYSAKRLILAIQLVFRSRRSVGMISRLVDTTVTTARNTTSSTNGSQTQAPCRPADAWLGAILIGIAQSGTLRGDCDNRAAAEGKRAKGANSLVQHSYFR